MILAIKMVQILLSLLVIVLVLIQSKGGGLSATFGGGEIYHTRRGAEKVTFVLTIASVTGLVISSVVNVWLN